MSDDPLTWQLFNEIGIIDQLAGTMFERVLPGGMTRAQFTVLNHFVRLGHAHRSPGELARALQVTRATMTSTLGRMARAGLVTIAPEPRDGRGKRVALTPAGLAMRGRCLAAVAPLLPMVDGLLDAAEIAALLPPLRTLRAGLDRMRDPPAN
ncbi:MAG: MarR family winged helix-turn-helix transcriptional regulator [Novosphingobium sp.]